MGSSDLVYRVRTPPMPKPTAQRTRSWGRSRTRLTIAESMVMIFTTMPFSTRKWAPIGPKVQNTFDLGSNDSPPRSRVDLVDSDTVFTDMDFNLPLDRYKDHNLVVDGWPGDREKWSWSGLNACVLPFRNCQWSTAMKHGCGCGNSRIFKKIVCGCGR